MPVPARVEAALTAGARRARELALRWPERPAASADVFSGFLIAEGDSWFNYPLHDEVVEKLEDRFHYRVESAAMWGDTAENMAYCEGGHGRRLLEPYARLKRRGHTPRAILLSCGGNDVAGDEFSVCLNHARSETPGLNLAIVAGVMERLELSIATLIGLVKELGRLHFAGQNIPVLIHGYGYPVPDGRGFYGGAWLLPGPWLEPGFARKGYLSLDQRCRIMRELIDAFNEVLQRLASALPGVTHVDVRPALVATLPEAYRRSWANELHPTGQGFEEVARYFDEQIRRFPMPEGQPR